MSFVIKRVYEKPTSADGTRVLVDRLWPRGISKERAALDHWLKEVAPSPKLRLWFGHEADKCLEFARRYEVELDLNDKLLKLWQMGQGHCVTLVYAAQDPKVNHAAVLQHYLSKRRGP